MSSEIHKSWYESWWKAFGIYKELLLISNNKKLNVFEICKELLLISKTETWMFLGYLKNICVWNGPNQLYNETSEWILPYAEEEEEEAFKTTKIRKGRKGKGETWKNSLRTFSLKKFCMRHKDIQKKKDRRKLSRQPKIRLSSTKRKNSREK